MANIGKMKKFITIKISNERYIKLKFSEILFIESDGDYSKIYVIRKDIIKYAVHLSLTRAIEILDERFSRCHKRYIINCDFIEEIKNWNIQIGEYNIPISELNKKEILEKVNYIHK